METEKELNDKILAITLEIQKKHPELSKYLDEMPVTLPDENNPEITVSKLKDYYNSLTSLIKKYETEEKLQK